MRFILGLLLGVALGASAGLLVAPQSRSEMRRALSERVGRGAGKSEDEEPVQES